MRKQDLEAQFADVERRRLEGKLSHEEAIIARQNLIQENQEKARSMREEVGLDHEWSVVWICFVSPTGSWFDASIYGEENAGRD